MIRRLRVRSPPGRQHSFVEIDHIEIFSKVTSSSADSRRTVVSFWPKNLHNTSEPLRGLSLLSKCVVRQTDHVQHDPNGLTGL